MNGMGSPRDMLVNDEREARKMGVDMIAAASDSYRV